MNTNEFSSSASEPVAPQTTPEMPPAATTVGTTPAAPDVAPQVASTIAPTPEVTAATPEAPPHLTAESQISEVQSEVAPAPEVGTVPQPAVTPDTIASLDTTVALQAVAAPVSGVTTEAAPPAESAAAQEVSAVAVAPAPVPDAPESTVEIDRTAPPEADAATPPLADTEMPQTEALRALYPGAFLGGEWEVKEVLARGTTNLYRVSGGDYSAPENKILAERAAVANASDAAPAVEEPASQTPAAAMNGVETPHFWDDLALHAGEIAADHGSARNSTVLVQPTQTFSQDEREYQLFDWFDSTSLQDWREPTNDERLLTMLAPLARFLADTEARGESAELSTDTLRIDARKQLRYVGFLSPRGTNTGAALVELRRMTNFLLKHVVAESATMRLDDRYSGLALSDEVKEIARRLDDDAEGAFASVAEAAAAIERLIEPLGAIDAALLGDVGREREVNEDSGLILRSQRAGHLQSYERELYIVSDGMGGHEGGEIASDLTISSLVRNFDAQQIDWNDNVAVRAALIEIIDAVNAEVVALTETPKYAASRAKPGATLTFALRLGSRVFLGNVGDSRAYIVRDGKLTRATKDHSYVQNLVDRGEITDDEAWEHPEGSVITAHIGYAKLKTRDVFIRLVRPSDTLLIVSDGVVDMLRDRDIAPIVGATGGAPHLQAGERQSASTIVRRLVDSSNAAGGADNITAICVHF
ncbi:MAG TPA: protein phosphatase 2C domain-containing protein [Abditibacteriaceae bacterium]|jgi:protein phosphatase